MVCSFQVAADLKAEFEADMNAVEDRGIKEVERRRQHDPCACCLPVECLLCHERCLRLEAPTLVCHGQCGQRIKKTQLFYISADGAYVWCLKCYSASPQRILLLPDRPHLLKKELLKRVAGEEVAEPTIACCGCARVVHQICALYSDKLSSRTVGLGSKASASFLCPLCLLESVAVAADVGAAPSSKRRAEVEYSFPSSCDLSIAGDGSAADVGSEVDGAGGGGGRRKRGSAASSTTSSSAAALGGTWQACSLRRSKLSDFLEKLVTDRLGQLGHAEVAATICIRMVSNHQQWMEVPAHIVLNFASPNGCTLPDFLPFRQKCILLFQRIDGVDVCLFCLYVQEFDGRCPPPNTDCVYIAYLDSVDYFKPLEMRTQVYHEVLVGYLKWAQVRGFKQGHIWSCPPQRGDNFIFWNHPPHQRTPSRDRLNAWYNSMLLRTLELGILDDVTNMHDAYFKSYARRDRDEQDGRQAARRAQAATSHVLVAKKALAVPTAEQPVAASLSPTQASSQASGIVIDLTSDAAVAPSEIGIVAPPIFEGDLWVNECSRIYKVSTSKVPAKLGTTKAEKATEVVKNLKKCKDVLRILMSRPTAISTFSDPVDHVGLGLFDYLSIVSQPMDLGTIKGRLKSDFYDTVLHFASDIRLCYSNAMLYNPPTHPIHVFAASETVVFERHMGDMIAENSEGGSFTSLDMNIKNSYLKTYPLKAPPAVNSSSNSLDAMVGFDVVEEAAGMSPMRADSLENMAGDFSEPCLRRPGNIPLSSRQESAASAAGDHAFTYEYKPAPFVKSEMGYKAVLSLMAEISKNVNRFKDDLFVVRFADLSGSAIRLGLAAKRSEQTSSPSGKPQAPASSEAALPPAQPAPAPAHAPTKGKRGRPPLNATMSQFRSASSNASSGLLRGTTLSSFNFKVNKGKLSSILKRSLSSDLSGTVDSAGRNPNETCLAYCRELLGDDFALSRDNTVDPDESFRTPFVDNRHTMLETCQYLHYQFDSLRRAKHSSAMLLYHLHNPRDTSVYPACHHCRRVIKDIRWHASGADYCSDCYNATLGADTDKTNNFTPFRVSLFSG